MRRACYMGCVWCEGTGLLLYAMASDCKMISLFRPIHFFFEEIVYWWILFRFLQWMAIMALQARLRCHPNQVRALRIIFHAFTHSVANKPSRRSSRNHNNGIILASRLKFLLRLLHPHLQLHYPHQIQDLRLFAGVPSRTSVHYFLITLLSYLVIFYIVFSFHRIYFYVEYCPSWTVDVITKHTRLFLTASKEPRWQLCALRYF